MRFIRNEILYNVGTDKLKLSCGFSRIFFINFLFEKLINSMMDKSLKKLYVEKIFYDILYVLKLRLKFTFDSFFFWYFIKSLLVNFKFLHTYKSGKLVRIPVIHGEILSIFNGLRLFRRALKENLSTWIFKEKFLYEFLSVVSYKSMRFFKWINIFKNLFWIQSNSMWLQLKTKYNILVFSIKHNLRFLKTYKDFSIISMILQKMSISFQTYRFYDFFKVKYKYLVRKTRVFENVCLFKFRNFWVSYKFYLWRFLQKEVGRVWRYVYMNYSLKFYWILALLFKYVYCKSVCKLSIGHFFFINFFCNYNYIYIYSKLILLNRLVWFEIEFYWKLLLNFKRNLISNQFRVTKRYLYKDVFRKIFEKLDTNKKILYKLKGQKSKWKNLKKL